MSKKLIPIILVVTSMVACNHTNSVDTSINGLDYDHAYQEIETFFNTPNLDFTMRLASGKKSTSLIYAYSDGEVILEYPYSKPDLKEITTKDKSFLDGDGFKVYIEKDNSKLFGNGQLKLKDYFKGPATFYSFANIFTFTLDLKELSTKTGLFDSDALEQLNNELFFDLGNVDFEVSFTNERINTVSMVFDEYVEAAYGVIAPLRIVYDINSYGDNFSKRTISLDDFLKVDQATYDIVEKDFAYIVDRGQGYSFRSNIDSQDYFINEIPGDTVVAYFASPIYGEENIEILFKDTIFDEQAGTITCSFAGKFYTIYNVRVVDGNVAERKDEIAFDKADIAEETVRAYDTDNNRFLIASNGKVLIFDISTLEIVKEISVQGDVIKILVHNNVYHITTLTKKHSDGLEESLNRGMIYVIDRGSMALIESININTAPGYTTVDKRGDIIIAPELGFRCHVYIYHQASKTFSYLSNKEIDFTSGTYLTYDEDKDTLIVCDKSSSVKPMFFAYENGKYIRDTNHSNKGFGGPDNTIVKLFYNDYFVSIQNKIVNVKDWENTISRSYISLNLIYGDKLITFPGDNNIYIVRTNKNNITVIVKFDTLSGEITNYFSNDKTNNLTFGFVKNGLIYLYDNVKKSLIVYDVN